MIDAKVYALPIPIKLIPNDNVIKKEASSLFYACLEPNLLIQFSSNNSII